MTRHFIVFLTCFLIQSAAAQVQILDSLKSQLQLHPLADSGRVNVLNALSYQYQWSDFNQSFEYAEEALKIAEAISFQRGLGMACVRQAHCLWALGHSDLAIAKGLRAVTIAEKHGFSDLLAETFRVLAISYRDQMEIQKAVSYIRNAETLALQEMNWDLLARIYNLAGVIDHTREQYDSALMYYKKSLEITDKYATTKFHLSQVLSNIGEVYLTSDPDKGLSYFMQALGIARQTMNRSAEAGIMADIGRAHTIKKNFKEADEYLQQSLKLSRNLGLKRVNRHVYMALVDLKELEGKTTEALNYMRAYYDVRDSLLNGSKTRQIVELETQFEKAKQEQRIELLEQERRIQRLWTYVLIIGSLILACALVIIRRLQRLRSIKARELLETQRALNEKLRETDQLKSRFFATISHEFRTPLSLILGPLEEHLRSGDLTPLQKGKLALVQRNAHRLLALVNQLLDLSKLEAGKMELAIRPGNLVSFFNLLTASFDSLAENKQIHFVKKISASESPIGFDEDKVEKIVSNILFNAFKFTPPGGQVIFTTQVSHSGREIVISIADTGKGIPAEELANIFSPFYQFKHDGEDGQPGTGLGLSLVHELVKVYGGKISVESTLNQGTCFTIYLPLFDTVPDIVDAPARADYRVPVNSLLIPRDKSTMLFEDWPENSKTILVVEDNASLRDFIASGFRSHFKVLFAQDGEEGVAQAMEHIPDVIISDVMMPKLSGVGLTDKIKQSIGTCHIPVILLTARTDHESKIEGLRTGADEYVAKPFSMEELQVRVKNLIDQRERMAEKLRKDFTNQKPPASKDLSLDERFILQVKRVIEENIANSVFSVEMLAEEVNLSRAQLFRKLKALINTSPSDLINDIRLQRAAQLIRAKADNVAQIGYAVGFNEQSYFAKRFKKKYGVTPTEFSN